MANAPRGARGTAMPSATAMSPSVTISSTRLKPPRRRRGMKVSPGDGAASPGRSALCAAPCWKSLILRFIVRSLSFEGSPSKRPPCHRPHPRGTTTPMGKDGGERAVLSARRERVMSAMGGGMMVLPAAPERPRTADILYPYRQDSDFDYLTGLGEPEAVCVLA